MKVLGISGVACAGLWLAIGCGGATVSAQDGDAGPLAACGGNCSPAQIAMACSAICARIDPLMCPGAAPAAMCPMNCAALPSSAPSCTSLVDAYFRCVGATQPTCSDAGDIVFPACDAQQQDLEACAADGAVASSGPSPTGPSGGTGPSSPPGGLCTSVPASVCPGIPRPSPSSSMSCSGGGGSAPNGPYSTTTVCEDASGNAWQASCTGATCTCMYNGGPACTCTMTTPAGTCNSCCPGTG